MLLPVKHQTVLNRKVKSIILEEIQRPNGKPVKLLLIYVFNISSCVLLQLMFV